jgi:ferredoxin-thioredoxin reductase catalytic subunit
MNAEQLYETLKKIQEPKGYHFNSDMDMTMPLLKSLLVNKERYGHMACPCRFASGDYEADKDIICPCVYREPDVAEYGACFCGLYVSKEWNDGTIDHQDVPERRPAEKTMAALDKLGC